MKKETKDPKYMGSIETTLSYNDPQETEISLEYFTFQNVDVCLLHGLDGETATVSIAVPSKVYEDLSVMISAGSDEILFAHQRGDFSATAEEIVNALLLARAVKTVGKALQ